MFHGGECFNRWQYPASRRRVQYLLARLNGQLENGDKIEFNTIGIDPGRRAFIGSTVHNVELLNLANNVLMDRQARGLSPSLLSNASLENPVRFEARSQQLAVVGTVAFGGGFSADGSMVVSDQTFMRLFPTRIAGAPNHILLKVLPGEKPSIVADRIREVLNVDSLKIRSFSDAIEEDVTYQTTVRPTGLIFGFGVAIGIIVGIVIVYQILSTDVADHLREYATFKAMGYGQSYFTGVVLEEAIILAVTGFFPALFVSIGIYSVMAEATGLPIAMSVQRAVFVLLGTIASCGLSGIVSTRKLANAEPADLF